MIIEHGRSNGSAPVPSWQELEKNLVGSSDLAGLIDELSVSRPDPTDAPPALVEVLGPHRRDVLDHGLEGTPPDILETLARFPMLLRDLQVLIFAEGGDYWMRQIDQAAAEMPPEFQAIIERTRKKIDDWTKRD
jgi:hypothetical protein